MQHGPGPSFISGLWFPPSTEGGDAAAGRLGSLIGSFPFRQSIFRGIVLDGPVHRHLGSL